MDLPRTADRAGNLNVIKMAKAAAGAAAAFALVDDYPF
jgi:hypothetical protein